MPDKFILVISDNEALMNSVIRVVKTDIPSGIQCLSLMYSRCTSQLPNLIPVVDLFILDLLRHYPGGMRAEGVTLAQRLWKRGKPVLIISPLHCAGAKYFPVYWDTASTDSLENRVGMCLRAEFDLRNSLMELRSLFGPLLSLPQQH